MAIAPPDRHAAALRLHAEGRPADALQELAAEARERLRDPDLLNDLGVLALEAGDPQAADAVLRTALLLTHDPEVEANVAVLDEQRGEGFMARMLLELAAASLGPDLWDNFDPLGEEAPCGPVYPLDTATAEIMRQAPALEWLYRNFADDASRYGMARLFAFRLLGGRKVALPLAGSYQRLVDAALSLRVEESTVDLSFRGLRGDRFDLTPLGVPVEIEAHPTNIIHAFLVQQYSSPEQPAARVRPGDVVIDGGGCWGDTALYFANLVGSEGRVVSYEFSPSNLELLEANLARNPALRERVAIERRALWSASDERLALEADGPASKVGSVASEDGVLTRAIDDVPEALGLPRIDFIKLDVEGAELRALQGAARTLRRDRPRLAIAFYHQPSDWVDIPAYLDGLGVGYRFSLGHFTVNHCETVLYAWCDEAAEA